VVSNASYAFEVFEVVGIDDTVWVAVCDSDNVSIHHIVGAGPGQPDTDASCVGFTAAFVNSTSSQDPRQVGLWTAPPNLRQEGPRHNRPESSLKHAGMKRKHGPAATFCGDQHARVINNHRS
jgi:hypothetical protein